MRLVVLCLLSILMIAPLQAERTLPMDYFSPLSTEDQSKIRSLINTLGNSSTLSLMFKKKKLEKLGESTSHVHPLRFLRYVFTDEELNQSIKNMGSIPWKRFRKRFSGRLRRLTDAGMNGEEVLQDFAAGVRVEPTRVQQTADEGSWELLLNYLTQD